MRMRKTYYRDGTSSPWVEVGGREMHNTIEGEPVVCKRGGEVLDFGIGEDGTPDVVEVSDNYEKARELRKRGVMPAPSGMPNKPPPPKVEGFLDFWERTEGRSREEIAQHCRLVERR
jgi:hypothetical protein